MTSGFVWNLDFEIWFLFGFWTLEFGIWDLGRVAHTSRFVRCVWSNDDASALIGSNLISNGPGPLPRTDLWFLSGLWNLGFVWNLDFGLLNFRLGQSFRPR
jgi:hypothetical protein